MPALYYRLQYIWYIKGFIQFPIRVTNEYSIWIQYFFVQLLRISKTVGSNLVWLGYIFRVELKQFEHLFIFFKQIRWTLAESLDYSTKFKVSF